MRLVYKGSLSSEDILKRRPEYHEFLDTLTSKGWEYHYAEMRGEAISNLKLKDTPYRFRPKMGGGGETDPMARQATGPWGGSGGDPRGGPAGGPRGTVTLEVDLPGERPPIEEIASIDALRVNISTKKQPRAVTIDLATDKINYVHPVLWEIDPEKPKVKELKQAREVRKIVRWLLDEKNLQIAEELNPDRFQELESVLDRKS